MKARIKGKDLPAKIYNIYISEVEKLANDGAVEANVAPSIHITMAMNWRQTTQGREYWNKMSSGLFNYHYRCIIYNK